MLKTHHFGSSQRYTTLLTAGCSTWVPQESRKSCSFHDLLCASDTIEPTHDLWTTIRIIIIPHPRMFIARKEWHYVFVLAELVAHYHGDPAQSSPESNPKIICEKQTWTCFGPNFYSSCTYTHLMNGTWQCPLPFSAQYHTIRHLLFTFFGEFRGWGWVLVWDSPTSDICIIVKRMSVPLVRTPLMYPPFGNGQILGHLCWTGWRVKGYISKAWHGWHVHYCVPVDSSNSVCTR